MIFFPGGGGWGGAKVMLPPPPSLSLSFYAYEIIAFLTLKNDNIAKLRIEFKSMLLELPSTKIKGTYIKFATSVI